MSEDCHESGGVAMMREKGSVRDILECLPNDQQPVADVGGAKKWECFRDLAYYDMWCVRKVGERRFEFGYHVTSEGEARALCEELEGKTNPVEAEER